MDRLGCYLMLNYSLGNPSFSSSPLKLSTWDLAAVGWPLGQDRRVPGHFYWVNFTSSDFIWAWSEQANLIWARYFWKLDSLRMACCNISGNDLHSWATNYLWMAGQVSWPTCVTFRTLCSSLQESLLMEIAHFFPWKIGPWKLSYALLLLKEF